MSKTVLITGAKGQLGCELIKLSRQYPIFHFITTDQNTLDITVKMEIIRFLQKYSINYIIHCAAYTKVDEAEKNKTICYSVNCDAIKNLVEACQGKIKILFISTDYVFNGKGNISYTESHFTDPLSVYGKSKRDGEIVLTNEYPQSIIVRTSWLYSSFGNNFIKTILHLLKKQTNLNVVYDQIGTPTYAADLAQAILHILFHWEKIDPSCHGIFHYSNEGSVSWFDFAKKIAELLDIHTCKIHPVSSTEYPSQAVRPKYSVLDKTKIKKTFGITIYNWEYSLKNCIRTISSTHTIPIKQIEERRTVI